MYKLFEVLEINNENRSAKLLIYADKDDLEDNYVIEKKVNDMLVTCNGYKFDVNCVNGDKVYLWLKNILTKDGWEMASPSRAYIVKLGETFYFEE